MDLSRLDPVDVPLALAELHRTVPVGAAVELRLAQPSEGWPDDLLRVVLEAGGFEIEQLAANRDRVQVGATALRALPDHVGGGMRLLCCGLNPSLHAADAGVGYVTGSNRFWKAMAAAGLATRDRDPFHLLRHDRIGMTDLVKRPTARADEVTRAEFQVGIERLRRLCEWLQPAALAVVGLAGWRAAVDRKAAVGWQPDPLGPTPVYVLPSTSGLNAGTSLAELTTHLASAAGGPDA